MPLANIIASSKASASASKGPKGSGMRSLMAVGPAQQNLEFKVKILYGTFLYININ